MRRISVQLKIRKQIGLIFATMILLNFLSLAQAENFRFQFVCTESGEEIRTGWVDERISHFATFHKLRRGYRTGIHPITDEWHPPEVRRRHALSCDSLKLFLAPLDNVLDHKPVRLIQLQRQKAVVNANNPIILAWNIITDISRPDKKGWTPAVVPEIRGEVAYFQWDESWPDDYWVVRYENNNGAVELRSVHAEYREPGQIHHFFAIPYYTARP